VAKAKVTASAPTTDQLNLPWAALTKASRVVSARAPAKHTLELPKLHVPKRAAERAKSIPFQLLARECQDLLTIDTVS